MIKVITYGTFDLLHYGHVRLLERAKALGDYLIVGVTAEDFDRNRGKLNVQQSLVDRIDAVRRTGLADEIIVEEYDGQKIDDIKRYNVDIFAIGSDWIGQFDYLKEYCKVVYLERTEGISSSILRVNNINLKIGMVGDPVRMKKIIQESEFVNGMILSGFYLGNFENECSVTSKYTVFDSFEDLLQNSDGVYIMTDPESRYFYAKKALQYGKHVLCEPPLAMTEVESKELYKLAEEKKCILMELIKTAYATAYHRMLLLVKSGVIGKPVSISSTCTSIRPVDTNDKSQMSKAWNSISIWGPIAMLPIFQILGCNYKDRQIITWLENDEFQYDSFTKINFIFDSAVASATVGLGVKSEGELIISGTKGYVYVPAPWWKTEYFEVRYEHPEENRRYYYQLEGEGIRYALLVFVQSIKSGSTATYDEINTSAAISRVMEAFWNGEYFKLSL